MASAATMIGAMVLVQQLKLQATKLLTPSSPISNELTRLSVDDSRGGLNSFSSAHTICDPFDVHDLNMMMNESSESLNSNLWLNNEDHQSRCATSKYQLEFSQLFFPSDDQISLTKNCSSEPASLDDTSNGFGSVFNVAKSDEISDHPKSPLNNYHSKTLDIKDYKFLFPHTKFKNPTVCVATNFVFI